MVWKVGEMSPGVPWGWSSRTERDRQQPICHTLSKQTKHENKPTCSKVSQRGKRVYILVGPPQRFFKALRLRVPADSAVIRVIVMVKLITALYRVKANVDLSGRKRRKQLSNCHF